MAHVTGFGGAFLRAADPVALTNWYQQHLGMPSEYGAFLFPAANQRAKSTVCFFPQQDSYFPTTQPAMLNFQVDDLDALLDQLQASGVSVEPKREALPYGRFGWFTDPEGNRVELWQPAE